MIKHLHIKNFKSFKELDLPDISRVTLIGGRNNVGKTSLLEAIFLFYDTGDPGLFFRHLAWRGIEVNSPDADTLFAPVFRDFNMEHRILIDALDDIYTSKMEVVFNPSQAQKSISVDLSNVNNTVQARTGPIVSTSYSLNIHYKVDGIGEENIALTVRQSPNNLDIRFEPGPAGIFPERMRRGAIFLPLRLKVDPKEDAVRFGQLDVERMNNRVLDFLKVLEPNLVGITSVTLPQKSVMYADIDGMARKIPIAFMGDGMSRLLSIILAIATMKNGIVLIDEVDAGIHYSVLPKIWEGICGAAREFNCQIIATTHSYECLQAAYSGATEAKTSHEFRYIRLDRQNNDVIAKTYLHNILGAALEHGWEVR